MSRFLKIGGRRPVRVQYAREVSSPKSIATQNSAKSRSEPDARTPAHGSHPDQKRPPIRLGAPSKAANDVVDVASMDSFPCSDPPGYHYCHI
jgi:hypothetical protein